VRNSAFVDSCIGVVLYARKGMRHRIEHGSKAFLKGISLTPFGAGMIRGPFNVCVNGIIEV
jgi:hypothetical protein